MNMRSITWLTKVTAEHDLLDLNRM